MRGQNIRLSGRASNRQAVSFGSQESRISGNAIVAYTHARIGMIEYLSIAQPDGPTRPATKGCVDALGISALCLISAWIPITAMVNAGFGDIS